LRKKSNGAAVAEDCTSARGPGIGVALTGAGTPEETAGAGNVAVAVAGSEGGVPPTHQAAPSPAAVAPLGFAADAVADSGFWHAGHRSAGCPVLDGDGRAAEQCGQ
jgi:hypothetical protein